MSIWCAFFPTTHPSKMNSILRTAVATALLVGASSFAQAQSSSGNITGEATSGETITVHGVANGFHRELTIDQDGKYNMRRVPLGTYTVIKTHADGSTEPPKQIEIHTGVTVRIQ